MKITELAAARAPQPEHVDELRQRAVELARPLRPPAGAADASIIFELSGASYAVAARVALQVAVLRELTPLPGATLPLFGVTQWRGDVLTILDIREMLGLSRSGLTDLGRVIVVDGTVSNFGLLADAVRDVRDISESDVRDLPADEDARHSGLLRGITDDGVLVIDNDTLRDLG